MNALESLTNLMNEPGRNAVLRSELLAKTKASPSSCDRALKKYCELEKLVRVGQGVYGIGRAKVFDIVPEVMPKLGYQIQAVQRVRGYSQKSSGRVWRLDRPCRRQIRKKGVHAVFEVANGIQTNQKEIDMTNDKPDKREIEDHYHSFEYCHSFARAEKDLIVQRALDVLETFNDERAQLAIGGGTSIAYYYRYIRRFSEDLDVRILLDEKYIDCSFEQRVDLVKQIGQHFRAEIETKMPFLKYTKKGRIRKDGVVQTLIFDYVSTFTSDEVVAGLKVELVHVPVCKPISHLARVKRQKFRVIHIMETLAGKWEALAVYFVRSERSYPDLIRHVHDLAMLSPNVTDYPKEFVNLLDDKVVCHDTVTRILNESRHPFWRVHYEDYMKRMGSTTISDQPLSHPTWDLILGRFEDVVNVILRESC